MQMMRKLSQTTEVKMENVDSLNLVIMEIEGTLLKLITEVYIG